MKKALWIGLTAIVCCALWYLFSESRQSDAYINNQYGFRVTLPKNWQGYSVSNDQWSGYAPNDQLGEIAYATGTVVSIHNPKWTQEAPYQDIPIMVFTLAQWKELQEERFHIGAAPIPPSELARNIRYVFALPARYNFSYPPGYEEVEAIMTTNPVQAF